MEIKFDSLERVRVGLRGGPSGDLYIVVSVNDHDVFYRDHF